MADEPANLTDEKARPLLGTGAQIEHLTARGISFDLCAREDAEDYLTRANNLFRASSYRKLFPLQDQGKRTGEYLGLDFGHLRALSSLDRKLRMCFMGITVGIEHFARIKLLNACEAHGEDGYAVVVDYLAHTNHKVRNHIMGNMKGRSEEGEKFDEYSGDLIAHYLGKRMPVWVFLEIVEFGVFNSFYLFCAERWGDEEMRQEHYVLRSVQKLRNACAHNSCVLNGVARTTGEDAKSDVNELITKSLNAHGMTRSKTRRARLNNLRTEQMASALYASNKLCTREETRRRHAAALADLRGAWQEEAGLFAKNNVVTSFFDFFFKMVDIWVPEQP